jgi:hypothetical protein
MLHNPYNGAVLFCIRSAAYASASAVARTVAAAPLASAVSAVSAAVAPFAPARAPARTAVVAPAARLPILRRREHDVPIDGAVRVLPGDVQVAAEARVALDEAVSAPACVIYARYRLFLVDFQVFAFPFPFVFLFPLLLVRL